MQKTKFSPLLFLASLGAGGISVIPFAFLNYTFPHPKGLVQAAHIDYATLSLGQTVLFRLMEISMFLFATIHIVLSVVFAFKLLQWLKKTDYQKFIRNPLTNAAIMAPFISAVMTMNVFIGPVRYFSAAFADNLQSFMLPALIVWSLLWFFLMRMEIKLLKTAFENEFEISQINFSWLLHPFALGMLSVTGAGIAALTTNASIAHTAAFLTIVSGSMGAFLLLIKTIALFKNHFAAKEMPARQFYPSFLIIVPNVTLYAITAFRLGHYLEHQFTAELGAYFTIVMTLAFAFETWYLAFGIALLGKYFKEHFSKEYYISQWGLVCPVVAYAVLGSFVYKVFVPNPALYVLIVATMLVAVVLFFTLLRKHFGCVLGKIGIKCS